MKREAAPGFWPISRKELTWTPRTRPGPHPRDKSLPLVMVIREILGFARTAKEAIQIINDGKVKVDGLVRTDHRFPVGLMDVLQIDGGGQTYRVLPVPKRGLAPTPIENKEAGFKLCKVVGKRNVVGGKTQLNLHDGRNIVTQPGEQRQRGQADVEVGGAVQLALPEQKIVGLIPFQTGAYGLVVDGRNLGLMGRIVAINPGTYARRKTVKIETANEAFETPAAYVIPVGMESPVAGLGKQ